MHGRTEFMCTCVCALRLDRACGINGVIASARHGCSSSHETGSPSRLARQTIAHNTVLRLSSYKTAAISSLFALLVLPYNLACRDGASIEARARARVHPSFLRPSVRPVSRRRSSRARVCVRVCFFGPAKRWIRAQWYRRSPCIDSRRGRVEFSRP